eukprot:3033690-Lingulodinium_polyedra.AAC.1
MSLQVAGAEGVPAKPLRGSKRAPTAPPSTSQSISTARQAWRRTRSRAKSHVADARRSSSTAGCASWPRLPT